MQKARFVWRVLQLLLKIGQVVAEAQELVDIYLDRGYAAGPNALTDADLQVSIPGENVDLTGFTVAQFGEVAAVMLDQIAFMQGTAAVAQQDRQAVYNKYRRDI